MSQTKDSIIAKNLLDLCAEYDVWIEFRDNYIVKLSKFDTETSRVYNKAYSVKSYLNPITSFEDVIADFSDEADRNFFETKGEMEVQE